MVFDGLPTAERHVASFKRDAPFAEKPEHGRPIRIENGMHAESR